MFCILQTVFPTFILHFQFSTFNLKAPLGEQWCTVFIAPLLQKEQWIYKEETVERGTLKVGVTESGSLEYNTKSIDYDLTLDVSDDDEDDSDDDDNDDDANGDDSNDSDNDNDDDDDDDSNNNDDEEDASNDQSFVMKSEKQ